MLQQDTVYQIHHKLKTNGKFLMITMFQRVSLLIILIKFVFLFIQNIKERKI